MGLGLAEFTRTIAAGKNTKIDVRGNFVRVKESTIPLFIGTRSNVLSDRSGERYQLTLRKFDKLYAASEFDVVEVENQTQDDATVVLQIGYGDVQSEILSRTVAADSFANTIITLGAGDNGEQIIAANNQRHRLIFDIQDESTAGTWGIGPPGLTLAQAITFQSVFTNTPLECKGELVFYVDEALDADITFQIIEEVFTG